jgi:predicted Ser/Thr protein kinase
LPIALSNIVKDSYPEWFLPARIVLKRQKRGWEEEFDNEKAIYQALAPIQGKVVPVCYGEAQCSETETTGPRALVLSDIGGVSLSDSAAQGLGISELEKMLEESFRALSGCKVAHDDRNLDNYRLVDRKSIMIIDFDSSYVLDADEDPDFVTFCSVRFVSRYYSLLHRDSTKSWL